MKRSQYTELVDAFENKKLSIALNRLAIIAKQEGLNDFVKWTRYELDGYNEEIHQRSDDNQVPPYRRIPVTWYDVYNRPLRIQDIRDPKLFQMLSRWTMKQGIPELEGYTEGGKGLTIIPERLHLLSNMLGVPMRGGDIAREAIIALFRVISAEALRKLSKLKVHEDAGMSTGRISMVSKLKNAIFPKSDRAEMRRLINEVIKTDSSLNAFCLDYFPRVHQQFSGSMDRTAKLNLLLLEDFDEIRYHLECEYPQSQRG